MCSVAALSCDVMNNAGGGAASNALEIMNKPMCFSFPLRLSSFSRVIALPIVCAVELTAGRLVRWTARNDHVRFPPSAGRPRAMMIYDTAGSDGPDTTYLRLGVRTRGRVCLPQPVLTTGP